MLHPGFFANKGPIPVGDLARAVGAELLPGTDGSRPVADVRPLSDAGPADVSFLDNRKYLGQLDVTKAGFVMLQPAFAPRLSGDAIALVTKAPYRAFALALQTFYPEAMQCKAATGSAGLAVDPTARIEEGVTIEPGAVVGPEAMIGRGTRIAAGAVIGYRVAIGRDCYIGPLATVVHSLVGDRVIIHSGVRVGQDGFGFAMGREGHVKVPQIGRVIIQDDVEIGANTTIDRGALKDTIIGEGTKIDNLVQIGHNVIMGRHCVIVAQTGISGSTELGDFVVMGGQSGTVGHIKVGNGAQIAGAAHAKNDVPAGVAVAGTPAKPLKEWARELAIVSRLAARRAGPGDAEDN
jgi:UDP-3-O-[3-hydroxymyristoyl] glucosamine N-acyltransferase